MGYTTVGGRGGRTPHEEDTVHRSNSRADVERLSQVLADATFPAAKWQLLMHAEQYGADSATRTDLWVLPAGDYPTLTDVLVALGLVTVPARGAAGYRPQPRIQAAAREQNPG